MIIVKSLYFMLPAYLANMTPSLLRKTRFLSAPVDFGKKWKRKRILGNHKTWRGIIVAPLVGIIVALIQQLLFPYLKVISLIDYSQGAWLLGLLLGGGAIIGDLVKSFFKRRLSIRSGKPWPILDQIDFVVGALLFAYIVYIPPFAYVLAVIIISPLLHVISNLIGYCLKIQKNKW